VEVYTEFYGRQYSGRRLSWQHEQGVFVVRAHFVAGTKELLMGTAQTIVLLTFNDVANGYVSFNQLMARTGLSAEDLAMTLHSLVNGKVKLLRKRPKVF
jgi:hypothetical protein